MAQLPVCLALVFLALCPALLRPQGTPTTTLRVDARLVFLDITVLDAKGHVVTGGLTRDDFTITEDRRPQRIFSFEAPEVHVAGADEQDQNPSGKAPVTILLLDLLDSRFEDFAYIRYEVRRYLSRQPEQLAAPCELMVLGNQSLQMVQGYTRSKADLLSALAHIPAALPYKRMNGAFYAERFGQSIDALQQVALQNTGSPARKNVIWVGHGGPSIMTEGMPGPVIDELNRYVHATTNMLVNARISLFLIYPGLRVNGPSMSMSELAAGADIGEDDPFAGDINFGVFVNETGGKLFYNRNDVDTEIKQSQELGSAYYTLTYQPGEGRPDGRFRRIRVSVRDPGLHVLTKAGYFAPDSSAPRDARQQSLAELAEAAQSTLGFHALRMTLADVVRHPDTGTVQATVVLSAKGLDWQPQAEGKSAATLMLAAASLGKERNILASRVEALTVTSAGAGPSAADTRIPLTIRTPPKTAGLRVVVQTTEGGRMGSVELDQATLRNAPAVPTPEPKLSPRPAYRHGEATAPNP